ncbi:hypothetical protein [Pseudobdellovibrio exovorus]|uniref:Nitroreductase domain-containing protein n=1 Tax=Pseudobdellovibrio exovorus JSS TaxID=1184267 RepID=M4V4Q6_9BACT|nr:hypothetical protein [Pseudobdellovibrio exovorus]AGH94322.1 hypothetical protein A11Q_102 [Pseudobdellovibrio exovorus JSS]
MKLDDQKLFKFLKENFSIEIDENYIAVPPQTLSVGSDLIIECEPISLNTKPQRRSQRRLNSFECKKLRSILYHSCRVQDSVVTETNYLKTLRPYPSAGGRHPLELLCLTEGMKDLENGLWYFDPYKITLCKLDAPVGFTEHIFSLSAKLLENPAPPVVLLSVAILERTLSRYKNGLGLIWRDTGNMFSTISGIAQQHELESCQLGFSFEFQNANILGLKKEDVWITGGLALGVAER